MHTLLSFPFPISLLLCSGITFYINHLLQERSSAVAPGWTLFLQQVVYTGSDLAGIHAGQSLNHNYRRDGRMLRIPSRTGENRRSVGADVRPSPISLPIGYCRMIFTTSLVLMRCETLPWPQHNGAEKYKTTGSSLLGLFASVRGIRIKVSRPLWFILHFAVYISNQSSKIKVASFVCVSWTPAHKSLP